MLEQVGSMWIRGGNGVGRGCNWAGVGVEWADRPQEGKEWLQCLPPYPIRRLKFQQSDFTGAGQSSPSVPLPWGALHWPFPPNWMQQRPLWYHHITSQEVS